MRIEKWGFLVSYAIYLVFCIIFSVVSKDNDAISSMICSITIASTAFSISDFLFTKIDIDIKERELLAGLCYLYSWAEEVYMNKMNVKYGKEAKKVLSSLTELFDGNEEEIENFFEKRLALEEKEKILQKVETSENIELIEFVKNYIKADKCAINEDEESEDSVQALLDEQEKKEKISYVLASGVAVLGLLALLIVLTMRISITTEMNNIFTIVAFLCVIVNLILKDYYRASSIEKLEEEKKKILKDLER